jgi:hypothetical protein
LSSKGCCARISRLCFRKSTTFIYRSLFDSKPVKRSNQSYFMKVSSASTKKSRRTPVPGAKWSLTCEQTRQEND